MLSYRPFNSTMEPFCLEKVIHDLGCRVSSFHKITDESCYQLKHSAIFFIFFVKRDKCFFMYQPQMACPWIYMHILV